MFSEINSKLVHIQGELRKIGKYQVQFADYEQEGQLVEETILQLRGQFEAEQQDVEKLESISLTNLFATLSGKKDAKLSKEKQEMIVAQHKLQEAEKTKKEIDDSIQLLQEKIQGLEALKNKYQQLLLQKEDMIKKSTSPFASKVFDLIEQEAKYKSSLTELQEAIDAGKRVRSALAAALKSFESAGGWGTMDLFGGGTISGIIKHQHIDEAERNLHRAQSSMRQFQKELLDLNQHVQVDIDISGMLKFADFFFDGLIADFMVQNKINRALDQTKSHYRKIRDILVNLEEKYMEDKKKLEAVEKEKQQIVESL